MNPVTETPDIDWSGFTPEELRLISDAGIAVPWLPEAEGPWRPTTLDDLDYIGWTVEEKRREAARIRENAEKRASALEKAADTFERRYAADCEAVVRESLPRKKDGSYAKKSLVLDRVTVALTKKSAGYAVVDKEAVLEHITHLPETPKALADAVKFSCTYRGEAALHLIRDGIAPGTADLLTTPLKAYCESLPPIPDEHGEARPATIPGVAWVPESESFSFKTPKEEA